jgi:HEAT repeat protein
MSAFDILYSIGRPAMIELAKLCIEDEPKIRFYANLLFHSLLTGKEPDRQGGSVYTRYFDIKTLKTADALPLAMKDRSEELRLVAASLLREQKKELSRVVECLGELLRNGTTPPIRSQAALEIGKSGMAAQEAVPVLKEALRNSMDDLVRAAAAGALGELGTVAAQAMPTLEHALSDPSPEVREKAAQALKVIREGKK